MLKTTIEEALDLTRRLQDALAMDELDLCRDLLEQRAEAMFRFETAHQVANSQEQAICSSYLRKLFEEDKQLQSTTKEKFTVVQGEMRNTMCSSARMHSGHYANEPQNACLDRKA